MNESSTAPYSYGSAEEMEDWWSSVQIYSFALGVGSALGFRALLAFISRSSSSRVTRHSRQTQTPANEEDFFEEEDDEDEVVIETHDENHLGIVGALWMRRRARGVEPLPPLPPLPRESVHFEQQHVVERPKLPPMEDIESFLLAGSLASIFEELWQGPDFYRSVIAKESPVLHEWRDDVSWRTRRVESAHPLNVKVPRWTGIGDLSIPTIKQQKACWNSFVHERSQFSGFPLATCLAVESAWLFEEVEEEGGTAVTRVTYRYRCTFDSSVPRWIRRMVVESTREELKVFLKKYRAEVRKRFHDLSAPPGLDDHVDDESDVLEFPVDHVDKRDLGLLAGSDAPKKLQDDIIRNECVVA